MLSLSKAAKSAVGTIPIGTAYTTFSLGVNRPIIRQLPGIKSYFASTALGRRFGASPSYTDKPKVLVIDFKKEFSGIAEILEDTYTNLTQHGATPKISDSDKGYQTQTEKAVALITGTTPHAAASKTLQKQGQDLRERLEHFGKELMYSGYVLEIRNFPIPQKEIDDAAKASHGDLEPTTLATTRWLTSAFLEVISGGKAEPEDSRLIKRDPNDSGSASPYSNELGAHTDGAAWGDYNLTTGLLYMDDMGHKTTVIPMNDIVDELQKTQQGEEALKALQENIFTNSEAPFTWPLMKRAPDGNWHMSYSLNQGATIVSGIHSNRHEVALTLFEKALNTTAQKHSIQIPTKETSLKEGAHTLCCYWDSASLHSRSQNPEGRLVLRSYVRTEDIETATKEQLEALATAVQAPAPPLPTPPQAKTGAKSR